MANYEDKITEHEDRIKKTKYNKKTQHAIGLYKAQLAKLKENKESRGKGGEMKLQKAGEDLQGRVYGQFNIGDTDDYEAMKLGIEALKRLEQNRTLYFMPSIKLLPGETEE